MAIAVTASAWSADVPRTWSDAAVAALEVPLANPKYSPRHIPEQAYYALPPRTIYRSYPVYQPQREPAGYMSWLEQQEPQIAFDPGRIKTDRDWIDAGELVFNAPASYNPVFFGRAELRDPAFFEREKMPVAKDGTIPFARWVIRTKGKVELGSMGCNTCHTRVLADGTVVPGAQGNNPGDRQGAAMIRRSITPASSPQLLARMQGFAKQFEAPWVVDDPNAQARHMSLDEFLAAGEAIPAGVTARSFTSMMLPPQIPDLIGVKDRKYLDHTGLVRHRGPADLMRYSALVQDAVAFARYGDFPPGRTSGGERYSDEQLYALTMYLYALSAPPNPNRSGPDAADGEKVFQREGCGGCHTPPFYTNNKLIAVDGFRPPAEDVARFGVMPVRVGTDPRYALQTRKGTGYYKVPSLQGVWYRGPLGHDGAVATLEEWLDPGRISRVRGHEFGLKLTPGERRALLAFLRTL